MQTESTCRPDNTRTHSVNYTAAKHCNHAVSQSVCRVMRLFHLQLWSVVTTDCSCKNVDKNIFKMFVNVDKTLRIERMVRNTNALNLIPIKLVATRSV